MAGENVMLAKDFESIAPNKVDALFPAHISEKIDGAASKFYWDGNEVKCISRSGKSMYTSVDHICALMSKVLPRTEVLYGELAIIGMPFKTARGIISRDEPCTDIVFFPYDWDLVGGSNYEFGDRIGRLFTAVKMVADDPCFPQIQLPTWRIIEGRCMYDETKAWIESLSEWPKCEGVMIRSMDGKDSLLREGKRSRGMLRDKETATIDLLVHSVEEAKDKNGKPKGCVGRINVWYGGAVTGIGPGTLTAAQREALFKAKADIVGKIVVVKYKPDDSYDGLREGRFYDLHTEKDTPDA